MQKITGIASCLVMAIGLLVGPASAQSSLCGEFESDICNPTRAFVLGAVGGSPIAAGGAASSGFNQLLQNAGFGGGNLSMITTCFNCGQATFNQALAFLGNPGILAGMQQDIISQSWNIVNNGLANVTATLDPINQYSSFTNQAAVNVLQGGIAGQAVLDQTLAMANPRNFLSGNLSVPTEFGLDWCGWGFC